MDIVGEVTDVFFFFFFVETNWNNSITKEKIQIHSKSPMFKKEVWANIEYRCYFHKNATFNSGASQMEYSWFLF
jgi:hypothetical protein